MSDTLSLKLRGLHTYDNPLVDAPPGSLAVADNIVIDADETAQSRRGFDVLAETLPSGGSRFNKLFSYQNQLLGQYDASGLAYRNTGVGWSVYSGSYAPPDANTAKTRPAEANSNFYFTSSTGIQKLDAYTSTPVLAGMPVGLDLNLATTGSSGFLGNNSVLTTTGNTHSNTTLDTLASTAGVAIGMYVSGSGISANTTVVAIVSSTQVTLSQAASTSLTTTAIQFYSGAQVGYQILWGIKDANKNPILGEPSQLGVVINTAATTVNTTVVSSIPSGITTSHFYQVYRSPQTVSAAISPNYECQLIYEANPSSGDISAGYISFTDVTADSLRGATIYTAASQEGALQPNTRPPLAKDMAYFKNCMLYANTASVQTLKLTILAVGGTSGIADADTITIAGTTYTGHTTPGSENAATNTFQIDAVSTDSPSQKITNTAQSLCRVINQSASNTLVYARYMSALTDLPGLIWIQSRTVGASTFYAVASAHSTAYSPNLPTSGTTVASTADTFKNAIYASKVGQPEAVPTTNVFFVGSAAYDIKRIIPLRDSVYIFKDDGIFKLIGFTPATFYVDLFDDTTRLIAPDTAVSLNNTIYCLTNQGVVSVADTGIQVVSRPIEGDLLTLFGANLTSVQNLSFGVSYQSDRKYVLGIISNAGDSFPTQMYVYNLFTQAWTRWTLSKTCGIVNIADDKLYFGDSASNAVNVERKSFNYTDYVDGSASINITASSGTTVTLDSVINVTVGDLLYQSSSLRSVITSVNGNTSQVTVQDTLVWSNAAATVYTAINCVLQFQPQTGSNPQAFKQFSELELFFRRASFNTATLSFFTDVDQAIDSVPIAGVNNGAWGLFVWGGGTTVPWGGALQPVPIRTYVPRAKQRCGQLNVKLTHRVGYGNFLLNGINIRYRPYSERTTR